jgi:hypothetical protein
MSFILRSHHDRYRQRAREGLYHRLVITAAIIAALLIGYVGGSKKNHQDVRQMVQQSHELQQSAAQAEQKSTQAQADYQTLSIKFQQLEGQYKRDVPRGDLGLLTALVKEQLDKGMPVDRMIQIIRAAQPPRNCSQPQNKRFILSTPAYKGPDSAITFADGAITVTGSGEPSISNKQEKEAWFDPGKPVSVTFTVIGGKKETKTGLLPIHHTIILRDKEYRFTISEGPRSFIAVSSDNCDYMESVLDKAHSKPATDSSM